MKERAPRRPQQETRKITRKETRTEVTRGPQREQGRKKAPAPARERKPSRPSVAEGLKEREKALNERSKALDEREKTLRESRKTLKEKLAGQRKRAEAWTARQRERLTGRFKKKPEAQPAAKGPERKRPVVVYESNAPLYTVLGVALAAALIAGVCNGTIRPREWTLGQGNENDPNPRALATPTPSAAAGTPGPTPTPRPTEAPGTAGQSESTTPAHIELSERVATPERAASMFGGDSYSRNPANWSINEFGGATLNPDRSGKVSRINTAGAVWEAWVGVDVREENSRFDAEVFAIHPDAVQSFDARGGTAWMFGENTDAGFRQVLRQLTERELLGRDGRAPEQPGVVILPVCPPGETEVPFVNLSERIATRQTAAERFGADSYSRNPANWFINEFGGATLNPDRSGKVSRVQTGEAVLEAWVKVDVREENSRFDAEAFVIHPDAVKEADIQGGTFWMFGENTDQGFKQVLRQLTERELLGRNGRAPEQPGISILPVCPTETSPTPTQPK